MIAWADEIGRPGAILKRIVQKWLKGV